MLKICLRWLALLGVMILMLSTSSAAMARGLDATTNKPLQFKSGEHLVSFQPNRVYLVALDHMLNIELVGGSGAQPQALADATNENLRGRDRSALGTVVYRNEWNGIDVTFQAASSAVAKSTYTVAVGAEIDQIQLRYNAPVELQDDGSLAFRLESKKGSMRESAPIAWQEIDGARVSVNVRFVVSSDHVGFHADDYDPRYALTIDPTIDWTYYGFWGVKGEDRVQDMVLDATGATLYVTGYSQGTWGAPIRAYTDLDDAFVAAYNATTGALIWNTFLGGSKYDEGNGIALSGTNLYVVGDSSATWGAPLCACLNGTAVFIAKLDTAGNLLWNTFINGSGSDYAKTVAVDSFGNLYVGGSSSSTWSSPRRAFSGSRDGFVASFNSNGAILWNTFLGGSSYDTVDSLVVNSNTNIFVSGYTESTWGSPVRSYGGGMSDIFAAEISPLGDLVWNTFLGGSNGDDNGRIALDASGNLLVSGSSYGTWGAPIQAFNGTHTNGFVAKLNYSDGSLIWNTFFGGANSYNFYVMGIAVDASGASYVTGYSDATWGIPVNPFVGGVSYYREDIFVIKLNSSGITQWNTFLGGTGDEMGEAVAYYDYGANNKQIFVGGFGDYSWGSPVHSFAGGDDGVITKLNANTSVLSWNTFLGTAGADSALAVTLDLSGNAYVTGYTSGSWTNAITSTRGWSGGQDAFVVKINSAGNWQWYTLLGGTGSDAGTGIAADVLGHVFVSGHSNASWGSPIHAFSSGYDTFAARLDASTGALQWNTFVGGSGDDYSSGLVIDGSDNVYVVGESTATFGSPVRAFGGGGMDTFVAKFDGTGAWQWHTFIGGAGTDEGYGITLSNNLLFVIGDSTATWGTSPLRAFQGNSDAYVAQVGTVAGGLGWNTFLGGSGYDFGLAITHDASGNLYATGYSYTAWGPTPVRAYTAGTDMFVTKLNAAGALQWNTFLGGSGSDNARAITVDNLGHIVVVGVSTATWGAPVWHYQSDSDISVSVLTSNGGLWWNGFLGNVRTDYGNGVVTDSNNHAFIVGSSNYSEDDYGNTGDSFDAQIYKIDTRGQVYLPLITR